GARARLVREPRLELRQAREHGGAALLEPRVQVADEVDLDTVVARPGTGGHAAGRAVVDEGVELRRAGRVRRQEPLDPRAGETALREADVGELVAGAVLVRALQSRQLAGLRREGCADRRLAAEQRLTARARRGEAARVDAQRGVADSGERGLPARGQAAQEAVRLRVVSDAGDVGLG